MNLCGRVALCAYEAAVSLSWPALYLYYLYRTRTDGKYRANYHGRMGLKLPAPLPPSPARIWIHALSVGEVLSSVPLAAELKRLRPDVEIVFSASTETGMTIAGQRLEGIAQSFFFMPHDFPWAVTNILDRVKPSLFVLVETDFWPNLVLGLKRNGIPAALVNGRLSPRSHRGYSRLGALSGLIFEAFDLIFSQTELDRTRFISLGAPPEKVLAAGNLKFDSSAQNTPQTEEQTILNDIGITPGRRTWVAGSTHEGEESLLLEIHRRLQAALPELLLIIAPRNIRRAGEIEALAKDLGFRCAVRSKSEKATEKDVFILDTLGELSKVYSACDVAFLGGSFTETGGHNPLEAVTQGKPACWGPHFYNFSEIERELLDAGCAVKTPTENDLYAFLEKLLTNPAAMAEMTRNAQSFAASRHDTANRIASALLEKLR